MSLSAAISALGPDLPAGTPLTSAVTIRRINAIQGALRALARADAVVAGPGVRLQSGSGVSVLSADPKKGGAAAAPVTYPFDVLSLNPNGEDPVFRLRPGTVNGLLPSNMLEAFPYDPDATNYVWLECLASQAVITSATVEVGASPPPPPAASVAYPPSTVRVILGIIAGGQWWRAIGHGSLSVLSREVVKVPKVNPAPGEYPFDLLYEWSVST